MTRPAVPNARPDGSDDPEGRQKNRRVEIVIHKR
jgi:outer membrane protein OmpA-like peptidoglycan-associated protein